MAKTPTQNEVKLFEIHCGLLPLRRRFIVASIGETRWLIPARYALDCAAKHYDRVGWYDACELREDKSLKQLHGKELRGHVEVNGDLVTAAKEERWSTLGRVAKLISGERVVPPENDQLWWFEEHGGSVDEMTDLSLERQKPRGPLWFSQSYADLNAIKV